MKEITKYYSNLQCTINSEKAFKLNKYLMLYEKPTNLFILKDLVNNG